MDTLSNEEISQASAKARAGLTKLLHEVMKMPTSNRQTLLESYRMIKDATSEMLTAFLSYSDILLKFMEQTKEDYKYIIFDLESTRRENEHLKKMIEDRGTHHQNE